MPRLGSQPVQCDLPVAPDATCMAAQVTRYPPKAIVTPYVRLLEQLRAVCVRVYGEACNGVLVMMTPCSRHIGRLEVRSFVLQKYLSGHVFKVEAGTVNGARS